LPGASRRPASRQRWRTSIRVTRGGERTVIIPLARAATAPGWFLPDAKLTDAQYQAYKAGGLYINVHSAENKGGEIRGQLK